MSSLKIGVSSSCFGFKLGPTFEAARKLRLDGIEHLPSRRERLEHLLRLTRRYEIPFLGLHAPWWTLRTYKWWMKNGSLKERLETWYWKRTLDTLEYNNKAIQFSEVLGAYVDIHACLALDMAEIDYPIPSNAVIENGGIRQSGPVDVNTTVKIAKQIERPYCLDTSHVGEFGENLFAVYERLSGQIKVIHFSDYKATAHWKQGHEVPGEGNLPLAELLHRLWRDNFNGIIIIELKPVGRIGFRGIPLVLDHDRILRNIKRSVEFVRGNFR